MKCKTKGVTFNLFDQFQKELFDYSMQKTNFSGYIKGLIIRDMLGDPAQLEEQPKESVQVSANDLGGII